jgi:disulfide bond formation protein DsbB
MLKKQKKNCSILDFESGASTNSATGARRADHTGGLGGANAGVSRGSESADAFVMCRLACAIDRGPGSGYRDARVAPALARSTRLWPGVPAGGASAAMQGAAASVGAGKRMQASIDRREPVAAAALVAAGGVATILGAYFFQYVLKLPPCPLCLEQRIAYYVSIPLAIVLAFAAARHAPRQLVAAGLVVIALAMLFNAGLALFHAGVEWKWWPGPRECSGPITDLGAGGDLLGQLQEISVVRCDEAAWRFLGLSLAGYNVLISYALAVIAAWGAAMAWRSGAKKV